MNIFLVSLLYLTLYFLYLMTINWISWVAVKTSLNIVWYIFKGQNSNSGHLIGNPSDHHFWTLLLRSIFLCKSQHQKPLNFKHMWCLKSNLCVSQSVCRCVSLYWSALFFISAVKPLLGRLCPLITANQTESKVLFTLHFTFTWQTVYLTYILRVLLGPLCGRNSIYGVLCNMDICLFVLKG